MNRVSYQRGFTLMHMMVALPLLAVFLLIGSKLFISNNQLLKEAGRSEERLIHTDHALSLLREDVWRSTGVQANDQTLILQQEDQTIRWTFDQEGSLLRVSPSGETSHRFRNIGAAGFEREGLAVVAAFADDAYLCPVGDTRQGGRP